MQQVNLEDKEYLVKYPWLLLEKGMNVIDIDYNYNYFMNTAISRGCKKIMVISPENSDKSELMRKNNYKKLELIEKVAFSKHGGYLNLETKDYVRYSNRIPCEYRNFETRNGLFDKYDRYYRCVTIDKVWYNQNRLHFINLDAKGFELEILNGGKCTINRNKPMILCVNNSYDVYRFLSILGYETKTMEGNGYALYYYVEN